MSHPSSSSTPTPERQDQQQKPPNQASPNTPQPPSSIPKKIAPLPWSHLETVNLIDAYQDKWYSLKRGQLKASQWEEVALSVASRCGFKELSKSATQCRHKMEKLRKRYRGEKQRGTPSVWTYFDMMDMMERGPFPISARPISLLPPSSSSHHHHIRRPIPHSSSDDDYEDDNVEEDESNKSRSINHILSRRPVTSPIFDALPLPNKYAGTGNGSGNVSGNGSGNGGRGVEGLVGNKFLRNPRFQKRKREVEEDEVDEEEEDEVEEEVEVEEVQDEGGRLLSELASAVRAFGEGFIRIENMKLEMMKEAERHRLEMEKRRMELIQESQQRIVDVIAKTFDSHKKSKNQDT